MTEYVQKTFEVEVGDSSFDVCEMCKKKSLEVKKRKFTIPALKIRMESVNECCEECAGKLQAGFDIMAK